MKKSKRKSKKMRIFLLCVLLFPLIGCNSTQNPNHLFIAHSHGDWHPVHLGLTQLAEDLEQQTNYKFTIYPNGQLGGDSDMIQLVKAGVLDMAKVSAGALEQFQPAYSIFSLPYVFQSTAHYFRVMQNSAAVQEIFRSTHDDGFIAIGWFDSGARSIYTTRPGPVQTPQDLEGLKIRTMGSTTSVSMIASMGGAATPMASGEVYAALEQHMIDGAENNETVLVDDGHGQAAKSYTYTQHQYLPDIVIMSAKTYDTMSEADRRRVHTAMEHAWQVHEAAWQQTVARNRAGAEAMGVQFYEIDKTPFINACQSQQLSFCAKSEQNAHYFADFQQYREGGDYETEN